MIENMFVLYESMSLLYCYMINQDAMRIRLDLTLLKTKLGHYERAHLCTAHFAIARIDKTRVA